MKVFLVGYFGEGAYSHILRMALRDSGHLVTPFDNRSLSYAVGEREMNKRLEEYLLTDVYDVLLVMKGEQIWASSIEKASLKKILWFPDVPWRYGFIDDIKLYFDEVYTTGKVKAWFYCWNGC